MRVFRAITVSALLTAVCLALWAFWFEPASLQVREYRLEIPHWPQNLAGLRVAALADLHVGSPFNGLDKLYKIVEQANKADPDLIVLLGDYVIHGVRGGKFVRPEEFGPVLGKLGAPLGVWAVLGNHDWWLDGQRVRSALEENGISVLEDAAVGIQRGGQRFWLAGIGDLWETRHDVDAALAGATGGSPILAITHNPDIFPGLPGNVSLLIAGHTHGGQVRVPFFGPIIVPSRYGRRFAAGHVVTGGRHIFVSTGLGTSILPVRFLVPPEISVLVLESAGAGAGSRGPT